MKIFANEMINFRDTPTPQGLHYNPQSGPSDTWCRQFLERHNQLKERVPEQRDKGRMRMSNSTVVAQFFKKYEMVLDELQLKTKPSQIFNCDETGFSQKQGGKRKVIGQKGKPCIQQQIHILGFPVHTTHLLQPCDVLLFGGLKEKMRTLANSMSIINTSMVVNKAKFPPLLSFSIDSVFSPAFVKSSFRKAGLITFNPEMIDKSMLVPEDFQKKKTSVSSIETSCTEAATNDADLNPGPSTSHTTSTENQTPATTTNSRQNICKECGASKDQHPLLSVQKLPKGLQSLFVIPLSSQPPKKKRKIVLEARIISGDDMLEQLRQKEREEEERRAGIERRKKEREEKRRQKTEEKARKTKGKGKRKCIAEVYNYDKSDSEEDETIVCPECGERDPREEENTSSTLWIACLICDIWYHEACIVGQANFICAKCKSKTRQ